MWEPRSCCCFKLRTGSLILGFLALIGAVINGLSSISVLTGGSLEQLVKQKCTDESLDVNTECEETLGNIMYPCMITSIVLCVIQALNSSLLIYGIYKNKTRLLIPFMITVLILIVCIILIALALIILFSIQQQWQAMLVIAIFFGVYIFLETYFLLVIRAYYLEVKRSKSGVMVLH
ncbi:uncharacterized protein [Procambarus clarkii]|uniref:uncharacterized protein n=1 Tax=Procambarus clarkii TaxID=6728 RepID=UPI0037430BC6